MPNFIQQLIARLSASVSSAGITQAEFEATVIQLQGQARRLFIRLHNADANTNELRQGCAIGNISEAARLLNRRLAAAGDNRRVLCTSVENTETGKTGYWRLASIAEPTSEGRAA